MTEQIQDLSKINTIKLSEFYIEKIKEILNRYNIFYIKYGELKRGGISNNIPILENRIGDYEILIQEIKNIRKEESFLYEMIRKQYGEGVIDLKNFKYNKK